MTATRQWHHSLVVHWLPDHHLVSAGGCGLGGRAHGGAQRGLHLHGGSAGGSGGHRGGLHHDGHGWVVFGGFEFGGVKVN